MSTEINLLKPANDRDDSLTPIQAELKKFCLWGLAATVLVGVVTLCIYLVVLTTRQSLTSTQKRLLSQLDLQKSKESMYVVIKSRIGIVDKAMASSKPMGTLVNYGTDISIPPKLISIAQDDQARVNVTTRADSVDEAVIMSSALLNHYAQKQIKEPRIESFSMDKSGIQLVFSFIPTWENL